jgi:SAM-dependent methyltransferase
MDQPADSAGVFLRNPGHCPTCDQEVEFIARDPWLRDHYLCSSCSSIPRERALMAVIESQFPNWRDAVIHESSPAARGASERLKLECPNYLASQFFPERDPGTIGPDGMRCENLEALTFADETIDLHVSQDVLEHVFHPDRVFREIARTLKPGGMHICTVPLVNKSTPSRRRAELRDGALIHIEPEMYHGNPIGDGRSLVTVDWGYDICRHILEASGLFTTLVSIDDLSRGIRAEYIEVLVTAKPAAASLTQGLPI